MDSDTAFGRHVRERLHTSMNTETKIGTRAKATTPTARGESTPQKCLPRAVESLPRTAAITGTGSYLPRRIVRNDELAASLGVTPNWIESRCGIRERRYVGPEDGTASMGANAALEALQSADCRPDEIDLLIFVTLSSDRLFPSSACDIQRSLRLSQAGVLEIHNQCSGFIYALATADAFIVSGKYARILVVCSEVHSRAFSSTDTPPEIAVLFGDGAAAVVVEAREAGGILHTKLYADGLGANDLKMDAPDPGGRSVASRRKAPFMHGARVYKRAVSEMVAASHDMLKAYNFDIKNVDLFIPHQSNLRILKAVRKRLVLESEQVFQNVEIRGNTSSVSIPLAMHEAQKTGQLGPGDILLLVAFGSGYTWGGALVQF